MVLFSFSTRKAIVSLILEEHLVSLEFRTIVPKVLQGNSFYLTVKVEFIYDFSPHTHNMSHLMGA